MPSPRVFINCSKGPLRPVVTRTLRDVISYDCNVPPLIKDGSFTLSKVGGVHKILSTLDL